MPMENLWVCSDRDDETVDCEIKYFLKEWIPDNSKNDVRELVNSLESSLKDAIPAGSVKIDEETIRVTGVHKKDIPAIKKMVEGKKGVGSIKAQRGKSKQTAISLHQTMTCHKDLSKDGKVLSVTASDDVSPYDHLPYLKPTTIIVHTEKLMEDWVSKIESFLGIPRDEIGQIGGGRKDHCFITLSTIQSLSKLEVNRAIKGKINLLISDEVHHSSADQWKKAVCGLNVSEEKKLYSYENGKLVSNTYPVKLLPAGKRVKTLGLSATPTPYGLERTQILEDCVGPTLINIKDSNIIDQGYILPVKILRESMEPEEQTELVTRLARIMNADHVSEINEKKTKAIEDFDSKYDLNVYEEAFQKAVGGAQFTASAYDEHKIKRVLSRIAETPNENFLVYSPRVIPLYAVSSLLRNTNLDSGTVPFVGKGSQKIKQYKGVQEHVDSIEKEIKKREDQIKEKEEELEKKGYASKGDKDFINSLKAQVMFFEEVMKVGIESLAREAIYRNVGWITSDPINKLQMPINDFLKVRMTDSMKESDLRPPMIVPYAVPFMGIVWGPRVEYKPAKFAEYGGTSSPWLSEDRTIYPNPAIASSIAKWQLMKWINEYVSSVKNLKIASSILQHDISKEEFEDTSIRQNFASGKTRVLPLSTAGQEGVDIPNANNLIVMSIFTKPKDPIQLTGRIKRIADGKKPGDALFLNIKGTSDDLYFRNLMKGLLLDVFETEHGERFRDELKEALSK